MTAGEPLGEPAGAHAPPDDAEQLRQEIERTREQLGETVEQLAAKVDVKSRAQAKAAELTGRVKTTAARARQQTASRAGSVRSQLAGTAATARQRAISAGTAGKDQLQRRAAPVREATPEPVRRAVAKGASAARERRVPLAVAAAVVIVGYLAVRQWRKR
jgi:small-conductance mechanosensitive channel